METKNPDVLLLYAAIIVSAIGATLLAVSFYLNAVS